MAAVVAASYYPLAALTLQSPMASGDEDMVLRFVSSATGYRHDIPVVRYLVKQACHCIPLLLDDIKARTGTTGNGLPIYQLSLDRLESNYTLNNDAITPYLLELFFSLVEVLLSRSLSDSVVQDAVARDRARQHHTVLSEARANILAIHALSMRLSCPRLRIWAEREIVGLVNDENALSLLQYILMDSDGLDVDVRPGCENMYRQVLLWFYCMRRDADETSEFKDTFSAILQRVKNSTVEDVFARRTLVDPETQRIEMRGCMVKCSQCVDESLYERTVQGGHRFDYRPFHLHSLTYSEAGTVGYWGAYMVDCSNGERAIVLKRVPPSIVQKHAHATRNADDTLTLDSQMALYHDASQTLADASVIDKERFLCSASLGFYRRASRANNFKPASLCMKDVLFNGRETALDLNGAPSSLTHVKLVVPSAVSSSIEASDRYHGTCQFCQQWRPVTILTYAIQIENQLVDPMLTDD